MSLERMIGIFFIILILLWGIVFYTIESYKDKCHSLGGVYINSQCFKADLIKIK